MDMTLTAKNSPYRQAALPQRQPACRRSLLQILANAPKKSVQVANVLSICASVLAAMFLMSCVLAAGPSFVSGALGILCITLARVAPDALDWIGEKARRAARCSLNPVSKNKLRKEMQL